MIDPRMISVFDFCITSFLSVHSTATFAGFISGVCFLFACLFLLLFLLLLASEIDVMLLAMKCILK